MFLHGIFATPDDFADNLFSNVNKQLIIIIHSRHNIRKIMPNYLIWFSFQGILLLISLYITKNVHHIHDSFVTRATANQKWVFLH